MIYRREAIKMDLKLILLFILIVGVGVLVSCSIPLGAIIPSNELSTTDMEESIPIAAPVNPFKAPLYWDAYEYCYTHDDYIPEDVWSANIDWVEENLLPYGYNMIAIDGWGPINYTIFSENGYKMTHHPSWTHDYAWWANNLQSRGMNLGMYWNPLWVSIPAVEAGCKVIGTEIPLEDIIDPNEEAWWFTWVQVDKPGAEEYVKGFVQHFANMGIKWLRVDFMSWYENGFDLGLGIVGPNRPHQHYVTALKWMREACDANDMFLSVVMPHLQDEAEVEQEYAHMVRVNHDCTTGQWGRFSEHGRGIRQSWWSQYSTAFDGYTYWSYIAGRNKMILDGDFIRINTFANDDEKKAVISLHLMAGGPVAVSDQYNTIGSNLWLYQNTELLALRTDGFVGKPLTNDPNNVQSQIWKGQMSNGDWIVGLFNREDSAQTRSIDYATDLGIVEGAYTRDLWTHTDLGTKTSYSASVPAHGVIMLKIVSIDPNKVVAPAFDPLEGIYSSPQSVVISTTTTGSTIHYTTDGTTPTTSSPVYSAPIDVSVTTTIKAFAVKSGMTDSNVFTGTYTMLESLPSPWITSDIGSVSPAGSASYNGATSEYINKGAGWDIEGTADAFHYICGIRKQYKCLGQSRCDDP